MKILFIGDLNEYGRSFQRYRNLKELGYEVFGLSHTPLSIEAGSDKKESLLNRIAWRVGLPFDTTGVNEQIKNIVHNNNFDLVWIEKGNTIKPKTLRFLKNLKPSPKLISCSEDDMFAKHNRSIYYTKSLPYYDIVFTTKTYNLEELKFLGASRTELFLDSYDEKTHYPISLTADEMKIFNSDVCFIGTFEKDRAESVFFLAKNGIAVTVWGNGWGGWVGKNPKLDVKNRAIYKQDYVKAICGAKINLCFLRKMNRDEVTSRSVEIPACGGFMLAERTKRHMEFFEEGKEVEFFGSNEELLEKTKKYLANETERKKIAEAGRLRCLKSGYSMREQLSAMIAKIENKY
jgi:hypothetical protein